MADDKHKAGKMNITDQEKTYNGFLRWSTNTAIGIIVFLIFLYLVAG